LTFHSPESGFCVLRVKVRGRRDLVTVLGSAAEIHAGEHIQASGHWEQHREHGPQFRALFLEVTPASSREGIERYLASGLIKGIGPHFAKRLVAAFGEAVFDVIEKTPRRLLEVDGIGATRLVRITAGWADQKAIREIMMFLQSHGVGTARAVRIYKTYGADAIPLVKAERSEPGRLCVERSVTFVALGGRPQRYLRMPSSPSQRWVGSALDEPPRRCGDVSNPVGKRSC
jgi:exodeoxyribonuclease V alpha subunit